MENRGGAVQNIRGAVLNWSGTVVNEQGEVENHAGHVTNKHGHVTNHEGSVENVSGTVSNRTGHVWNMTGSVTNERGKVLNTNGFVETWGGVVCNYPSSPKYLSPSQTTHGSNLLTLRISNDARLSEPPPRAKGALHEDSIMMQVKWPGSAVQPFAAQIFRLTPSPGDRTL